MKQRNHDSQPSASKLRAIFFGSIVTGPVNDLDSSDFSVRGISGKLFQESIDPPPDQKRKGTPLDKDK